MGFLVNSNLFIALCALAATWQTYLLLSIPIEIDALSILIFGATLFLYNALRLVRVNDVTLDFQMHRWMRKRPLVVYLLTGSGLLMAIIAYFFLTNSTQLALLVIAIISFFYAVPVVKIKALKFSIRDVGLLKPFIVGFVWAVVTVLLPILNSDLSFDQSNVLIFVERFLFISAITIPFDIKDMEDDAQLKYKTIPMKWGIGLTKMISIVVLIIFFVVAIAQGMISNSEPYLWMAYLLSFFITSFLITKATKEQGEYYYVFYLDSLIVLQFVLVDLAIHF